ncbi:MAG: translation elongation factor Ts [Planctomycetes bacterium]|nr:translation elongation factor Ts [Planctomycetota bacterium]
MSTPVTPQLIKQLRDRTDQPMGLCQQALKQSDGDMDKAIAWLQQQNSKMGVKREANETAEGRIGVFFDNSAKVAAIVEMRCESAPSAKSDQFIALANDIAKHVASSKAADVAATLVEPFAGKGSVLDRINDTVGVIREKMILQKFSRLAGGVFGSYVHHDGSVGVIVECKGAAANDDVIRDVAAHIAALNPPYANVSDVPADVLEKEKALVKADMDADPKNQGKPANILEKISEGKLRTKLAEIVLSEQQMANEMKYPKTSVGAALKKAGLEPVKFVRYKVGAVAL